MEHGDLLSPEICGFNQTVEALIAAEQGYLTRVAEWLGRG